MEKEECYLISENKKMCTGCRTCALACPKKCITMVEDECGFYYPVIDKTKCINCKRCIRICPVSNDVPIYNNLEKEVAYSYITNNEEDLLKASSGGAFFDIAKKFINGCDKYAIFGAAFDENIQVKHLYITDIKDIDLLRKSKYVQSDVNDSYINVKKFLNDGYKVVFSGTPCQIAGLKMYLNKEYENLLTIDLICHGVPSQKILNQAIRIEEKTRNIKITKLNFREKVKEKSGKFFSKNLKICAENKTIILSPKENAYLQGFQSGLFYRNSCYSCKFASIKRYSDVTIGDCWGIDNNKYDIHKGVSCIIIHTAKGLMVAKELEGTLSKLDVKFVIENNKQYSKPAEIHKNRNLFFNNLTDENFEKRVFKYTKKPLYKSVLSKIKRTILKILGK